MQLLVCSRCYKTFFYSQLNIKFQLLIIIKMLKRKNNFCAFKLSEVLIILTNINIYENDKFHAQLILARIFL